ncbi:hypothetical protein Tco_0934217 [Tanacetum coccineum]
MVVIKTTQKYQRLLKFQRDLLVVVEDEVESQMTFPEPRTALCDLYEFGRIWIPIFGCEDFSSFSFWQLCSLDWECLDSLPVLSDPCLSNLSSRLGSASTKSCDYVVSSSPSGCCGCGGWKSPMHSGRIGCYREYNVPVELAGSSGITESSTVSLRFS